MCYGDVSGGTQKSFCVKGERKEKLDLSISPQEAAISHQVFFLVSKVALFYYLA